MRLRTFSQAGIIDIITTIPKSHLEKRSERKGRRISVRKKRDTTTHQGEKIGTQNLQDYTAECLKAVPSVQKQTKT